MNQTNSKAFICYYAQDQPEFRLPELQSLTENMEIKYSVDSSYQEYQIEKPFLCINLQKELDARRLLQKTILMRYMVEPWACGCTMQEILNQKDAIKQYAERFFTNQNVTFKFEVEGYNKKLSMETKREWIDKLEAVLTFPGRVKMKDPDHIICLLLDFETTHQSEKPCRYIYLGRWIGNGQRDLIHKYSLKTRYYIGNTSMDPQLSFLMANQGQVKPGSFVYDPFVGTGSVLTCCAHFGAYTFGSDIDRSVIYGRGRSSRAGNNQWRARDEIIRTNYQQYNLLSQYVDVFAADVCRNPLRSCEFFDAIITDPPYGIREGGRKLIAKDKPETEINDDPKDQAFPASSLHQLSDIILDLIDFAALYLRQGGKLVYWLPVYSPTYTHDLVPQHPCFEVKANSEQRLTGKISRRLITMEKSRNLKDIDQCTLAEGKNSEKLRSTHNQFRANYFKVKT